MVQQINHTSELSAKVARWRAALKDEAVGPLIIAQEIVDIANAWESYRSEADDLDCTTWLRTRVFGSLTRPGGRGLAWWQIRAKAVEVLGKSIQRGVHHEIAVYMMRSIPSDRREEVKTALLREYTSKDKIVLSPGEAQRVIGAIVQRKTRKKAECARCVELEKRCRENGVAVD